MKAIPSLDESPNFSMEEYENHKEEEKKKESAVGNKKVK